MATAAKKPPAQSKPAPKPKAASKPKADPTPAVVEVSIAPSAIVPIPLGRLRRAPENVRKTNIAVDIEGMADDIAAKGLLQSLIGYAGDTDVDAAVIYIVGGGRRLQALQRLHDLGQINDEWPVPVLLRSAADAVDLSLSENLGKRDMNPADEFEAFATLMKPGTLSPADLAKRFGFSERYVQQRLRLAALAPQILDALRETKMTLDSAMAYAKSSNHDVQLKVFRAQEKATWKPHDPASISQAFVNEQMTTHDALFKFVGARDYEKAGGGYEDDLFSTFDVHDNGKRVRDPGVVLSIAGQRAPFQLDRIKAEAKAQHPTTIDVLLAPGIRQGKLPKAPAGCKIVERDYYTNFTWAQLRDRATQCGALITGVASVDRLGSLVLEDRFFVPVDKMTEVNPPRQSAPQKSQVDIEAERRVAAIRSCAAVLAAEALAKADTKGRRFYNSARPYLGHTSEFEGLGEVYAIPQTYYVTAAEIDAHLEAGAVEYARQEEEKAAAIEAKEKARVAAESALAARREELLAMKHAPAVVEAIDNLTFFRWSSGCYCEVPETPEAEPEYGYDDLAELLEDATVIGKWWATIEAYRADTAAADEDQAA